MKTPFDKFFDYNHDGELDWLEKGARDAYLINMIKDIEKKEKQADNDKDDDNY